MHNHKHGCNDDSDETFSREELIKIREKAYYISTHEELCPHWKLAYEQLAIAADHLDAMVARIEVKEESFDSINYDQQLKVLLEQNKLLKDQKQLLSDLVKTHELALLESKDKINNIEVNQRLLMTNFSKFQK